MSRAVCFPRPRVCGPPIQYFPAFVFASSPDLVLFWRVCAPISDVACPAAAFAIWLRSGDFVILGSGRGPDRGFLKTPLSTGRGSFVNIYTIGWSLWVGQKPRGPPGGGPADLVLSRLGPPFFLPRRGFPPVRLVATWWSGPLGLLESWLGSARSGLPRAGVSCVGPRSRRPPFKGHTKISFGGFLSGPLLRVSVCVRCIVVRR